MNKKQFLSVGLIATSIALLVSGCSAVDKNNNSISLKQNYETINSPQWDSVSVNILKDKGWEVTNYQELALKEGKSLPSTFSAMNKDKTCNVSYMIRYEPLKNTQAGEDYLTRAAATQQIMTSEKSSLSTQNIHIAENNNKLEMLEIQMTTPNYASDSSYVPIADPAATPKEPTPAVQDGNMYTVQLSRAFAKEYTNPFAEFTSRNTVEGYTPADRSKGNPILSVSYSCAKTNLDMELWKDIVKNATINSAALPTATTK